jgi:hypothetical protein
MAAAFHSILTVYTKNIAMLACRDSCRGLVLESTPVLASQHSGTSEPKYILRQLLCENRLMIHHLPYLPRQIPEPIIA